MNIDDKLAILDKAFSPSAPVTSKDLFAGRKQQLERSCQAINEKGQHFVIYGDRGVGKTSLANIIDSCLLNVIVSKVTCNRSDTFRQMWEKAFSKITFARHHQGIGFKPEKREDIMQLDLFLPKGTEISALDIQHTLEGVDHHLLFLFDEFDSVSGRDVQAAFADTVKALSDNAPRVTVGLIGIADDVDALIGKHASLERCLKQIEMPRMSKQELSEIVEKGLAKLEMGAAVDLIDRIVDLSSGFPHFTHLLAKYAVKRALDGNSDDVLEPHLIGAIHDAIENANQSIKTAFRKASVATKSKSKFEAVVKACALAAIDEAGAFAARDLIDPYYRVTGERVSAADLTYTLQRLCEKERGHILQKMESLSGARYRFGSPLMKTYVKLRIDKKGTFATPILIT